MKKYIKGFLVAISFGVVSISVAILCKLFRAGGPQFSRKFIIQPWLRCLIRFYGLSYTLHKLENIKEEPCVYISNHRSVIDFFVIGAMGLNNACYFISATNERYWPLKLIAPAVKFIFIPQQNDPKGRIKTFQYAEKYLKETGKSVYLSVEGDLIPRYKVEKFNKGAFHLATNLKWPISPFYIHVPDEVNHGRGLDPVGGKIDVYFLPQVTTTNWKLGELIKNRDKIYNHYLDFERKIEHNQERAKGTV